MASIKKGSAHFQMGIKEIDQLKSVLEKNAHLKGVAFVGRSNVGKSSLINSLFGKKTAKTSKTPGRTREINIFSFEINDQDQSEPTPFLLFDLPGYGFAEVSKQMAQQWDLLMATFFAEVSPHIAIVNIQDARHPNQKVDQQFHQFLKDSQQDLKTILVLNKVDKLKKQKERSALLKQKKVMMSEYQWVKEFYMASAESKEGLSALEQTIVTHCHT